MLTVVLAVDGAEIPPDLGMKSKSRSDHLPKGLAKSANTAMLYMMLSSGGLNLPSLTTLYKKLQVSRQCQLLTSSDPCVRRIAEQYLHLMSNGFH